MTVLRQQPLDAAAVRQLAHRTRGWHFHFTTGFGNMISYHIKNVTVDAQAITDPNHSDVPAFNYSQNYPNA